MDKLSILTKKKQILDSLKPLPVELKNSLEDWLRVELTYSSNAIEGNTLSRIETAEVIEKGISAVISGKPLKDQIEAFNHSKALDFINALAKQIKGHQFITEKHILSIHKIILSGILDDWAGKYRQTEVFIRGSNIDLPLPSEVPGLMKKFLKWLESQQEDHPVRIAENAHFKFESIHPFIDGNGRTGRLLMNLILELNSYPKTVIRAEERTQYLNSLNLAQTEKLFAPFYDLIENSVEKSLDMYVNAAQQKTSYTTQKLEKLLKIGALAKETGETVPTIRFWTQQSLLKVQSHTKKGYQLYNSDQIEKAKEIRRLQKESRLTLAEIKEKYDQNEAIVLKSTTDIKNYLKKLNEK